MKIAPSDKDFKKWIHVVPDGGDLVFLSQKDLSFVRSLNFPVTNKTEIQTDLKIWSLNARSWYQYALSEVEHCLWFPIGGIESLNEETRLKLAQTQIEMKISTLIKTSYLDKSLKNKFITVNKYSWLTSNSWKNLTTTQKISVLKAWYKSNKIQSYNSIDFINLHEAAQQSLRRLGYHKLLNTYSIESGPNCFAAASGSPQQWLRMEPFVSYLKENNFKTVKINNLLIGDILVYSKKDRYLHASIYLGRNLYFEKPGQDFYEPYRVGKFKMWKKEWPATKLTIWRSYQPSTKVLNPP